MGTRSLTKFIETHKDTKGKVIKTTLAVMYRQMDGYPSGMGTDLADFLKGGVLVNGISMSDKRFVFNGMGCLSAQVIAHFKDGPGSIYLYNPKTKDAGQEFEYEIEGDFDDKQIIFRCFKIGWREKKRTLLFEGSPIDFEKFVETSKD